MQGQNALFAANPVHYCSTSVINNNTQSGVLPNYYMLPQDTVYLELTPWVEQSSIAAVFRGYQQSSQVCFDYLREPPRGDAAVAGYYVPYLAYGVAKDRGLQTLEVSLKNPDHKFVFTGGQNGCSLLLAKKEGSDDRGIIVHYPNSDGRANGYPMLRGLGFGEILIDIHYGVYGEGDERAAASGGYHPDAFSFLWHSRGAWIGVSQKQNRIGDPARHKHGRPEMAMRAGGGGPVALVTGP